VAICRLVAIFAVGALIYSLPIFSLGSSSSAGLRRRYPVLIFFRLPSVPGTGVIAPGLFSIAAHGAAI
jgi:hypothetical protein